MFILTWMNSVVNGIHPLVRFAPPDADIDDGDLYLPMRIDRDAIPNRRPRLRLRALNDSESDAAGIAMERLGAALAAKITDAEDWDAAEGDITALPYLIYEKLWPYTASHFHSQLQQRKKQPRPEHGADRRRSGNRRTSSRRRRRRPPRTSPFCREQRLDEALDDLHAVESNNSSTRQAVRKARRRVGRIRRSQDQQLLRHRFNTAEKACVNEILVKAEATRSRPAATTVTTTAVASGTTDKDDNVCPITGDRLWQFFDGVNTPRTEFDQDAAVGTAFREALGRLPAAAAHSELLTEAPSEDAIERQLNHVNSAPVPVWTALAKIYTRNLQSCSFVRFRQPSDAAGRTSVFRRAGKLVQCA